MSQGSRLTMVRGGWMVMACAGCEMAPNDMG